MDAGSNGSSHGVPTLCQGPLAPVTYDRGNLYMCEWCYQQEPNGIVIKFKETERLILCAYAPKKGPDEDPLQPLSTS
jgi:hypothetical protein